MKHIFHQISFEPKSIIYQINMLISSSITCFTWLAFYFSGCIDDRDFTPGVPILDNTVDAIHSSYKVILVLTDHFVSSQWWFQIRNPFLLTYRFLLLLSLKYTLQKYNRLYYNLKDKIQEFMLCLKGKIHRKILVTLKFQDIIGKNMIFWA
jgi:hypothetical protein